MEIDWPLHIYRDLSITMVIYVNVGCKFKVIVCICVYGVCMYI